MSLLLPTLDIPTASDEMSDRTSSLDSALHLCTYSPELTTDMAGKVLPLIETDSDPLSVNGSVLSDGSYVEEGTPEPDDLEVRLSWGRKYYGESWYIEEVAGRKAVRNVRYIKEECERIKEEEVEAIRRLRETDPLEYKCQMTEYNLRLQGLTQEQIDKSNQPLPDKVVKSNWEGFSARL
jgi:hypothetical protein